MRALLLALLITPALFLGVQRTEAIRPTCGAGLAIVYSLPREQAHELCPTGTSIVQPLPDKGHLPEVLVMATDVIGEIATGVGFLAFFSFMIAGACVFSHTWDTTAQKIGVVAAVIFVVSIVGLAVLGLMALVLR